MFRKVIRLGPGCQQMRHAPASTGKDLRLAQVGHLLVVKGLFCRMRSKAPGGQAVISLPTANLSAATVIDTHRSIAFRV